MQIMGELVTLSLPSHVRLLSEGIWNLFQQNFETDLELRVKNDDNAAEQQQQHSNCVLKVHSLILCVFCPDLRGSLGSCKTFDLDVKLGEDDLKVLVEFLYLGKLSVMAERLEAIKGGAQALGLNALVDLIEKSPVSKSEVRFTHEGLTVSDNLKSCSKRKAKKPVKFTARRAAAAADTDEQSRAAAEDEAEQSDHRRHTRKRSKPIKDDKPTYMSSDDDESCNENSDDYDDDEDYTPETDQSKEGERPAVDSSTTFDSSQLLCRICDRKFNSQTRFNLHVRCHQNPSLLHYCQHCPFKTELKACYVNHLAAKHQLDAEGNALIKTFRCSQCAYSCVAEFQLKNHTLRKHMGKPFACDVCSYACSRRSDMVTHKNGVHGQDQPFMCETCGFRTKNMVRLKNHLWMHSDKVPCDICGQKFAPLALRRHRVLHFEHKKPFACHLCSFATRDRYNLKVHLKNVHKLHSDEVQRALYSSSSSDHLDTNQKNATDDHESSIPHFESIHHLL